MKLIDANKQNAYFSVSSMSLPNLPALSLVMRDFFFSSSSFVWPPWVRGGGEKNNIGSATNNLTMRTHPLMHPSP